jgi:hypothetical protein
MGKQRRHIRRSKYGKRFVAGKRIKEYPNEEVDYVTVKELRLWAENDIKLYNSTYIPWVKNFRRKMKRGIYNREAALYAMRQYFVPAVIKAYFSENLVSWKINNATKNALAKSLLEYVEEGVKEGVDL